LYRLLNTLEIGNGGFCNAIQSTTWLRLKIAPKSPQSFILATTTSFGQLNLWKKGISGNKCRDKQKYHCQWRDVHVFYYNRKKNLKVVPFTQ